MSELVFSAGWETKAFETITIDSTAGGKGFTAANYKTAAGRGPCKEVFCVLETAQIRFQLDGASTVTATTNGALLEAGQTLTLQNYSDIANFRAIRTGGTSGVLQCFYKF